MDETREGTTRECPSKNVFKQKFSFDMNQLDQVGMNDLLNEINLNQYVYEFNGESNQMKGVLKISHKKTYHIIGKFKIYCQSI